MMPLILPLSSPPSLSLSSPFLPKLNYFHNHGGQLRYQKLNSKHKKLHLRRTGICKAELQQDAPFAIAIGACMLNSLLFTGIGESLSEDDEDGVIGATDARFSVMTIISLIPYFNWLSWIFALMDTGKRRYAVYAIVYLAPYLRTNLSLSPEESWLPIASIVLCIVHIQLEASINSGDFDTFNFLTETARNLGLFKNRSRTEHLTDMHKEVRSHGKQSQNKIRKWGVPKKPSLDVEHVDEEDDHDDRTQH
ncbi:unnamed protein product [Amaranthus hypochondriacus]